LVELDNIKVGIDLVDINRFKDIPFDKNKSFYRKNFSENEIDYCLKFDEPYKHFAGKFAAKEAAKKTLDIKLKMLDIKIEYTNAKPKLIIPHNNYEFEVSISHDGNYAIAIVISKKVNTT
tara:strand:+ start:572 stop:931 length:360 start_codon:yes stop_codon:yes gene_type:complete